MLLTTTEQKRGGGKGGANSLTVLGTQTVAKNEMGLGWGEAHKKKKNMVGCVLVLAGEEARAWLGSALAAETPSARGYARLAAAASRAAILRRSFSRRWLVASNACVSVTRC